MEAEQCTRSHLKKVKDIAAVNQSEIFFKKISKLAIWTQSGMNTVNILHELYRGMPL